MNTDIKRQLTEAVEKRIQKNNNQLAPMKEYMNNDFVRFFQYKVDDCYLLQKENQILSYLLEQINDTEPDELATMVDIGLKFYTNEIMKIKPFSCSTNIMMNIAERLDVNVNKEMHKFYKGLEYLIKNNN